MKITGIVLILAGLAVILCGGFFNTSHSQVPDMGLMQVDDTENYPLGIPPILGIAAIAAGGALVYKARQLAR
jgi:drug/metabolite transporter (DMT)-like permease